MKIVVNYESNFDNKSNKKLYSNHMRDMTVTQ
jgi:hypothetical protein